VGGAPVWKCAEPDQCRNWVSTWGVGSYSWYSGIYSSSFYGLLVPAPPHGEKLLA